MTALKSNPQPRWLKRHQARLRAIDVLLAGREAIGDDMVIRGLVSDLLRSYRDVRWVTNDAAALDAQSSGQDRQVDHVIPVRVLVDRLLNGDEPGAVLAASGQCYVTKAEHNSPDGLAKFRVRHADLLEQMRICELSELLELGWKRYERAGIRWAPLEP